MTLARVELRRLLSRRAVRVLVLLFVGVQLVATVVNYLNADAGNPLTAQFVRDSGQGPGGGFAVLAFIVGATAGGAEWGARTVEALLMWEPRRGRVMAIKAGVLAAAVAVVAVVIQLLGAGLSRAAVAGRGSMNDAGPGFWSDYVGTSASLVALAVFTTLLGFGIASLTRNTGVALGVAFAYFAVIDQLLRLLPDWIDPFTVINNIGALVDHGLELTHSDGSVTTLTTTRAAVTLTVYLAIVLGAAATLFRRRDVS